VLLPEEESIQTKFKAARKHLNGFLLEPYRRQTHITLFVCGFLVNKAQHNDDFTTEQYRKQIRALEESGTQPFEIEIGGLNSFASAPYLEVRDPEKGITRLREVLSRGASEFRTALYTPHLTVGLYAGAFPSVDVAERMANFPSKPTKLGVKRITFAIYKAREIAGPLSYRQEFVFH
jgi:2'-5' RNA ligase